MTFNLEPPPGFRGLHPDLLIEIYIRTLPHWRQKGATYFVTFNLSDALPTAKGSRQWGQPITPVGT
ncbi:MAG: hypothetical protein OES79_11305, partial [Planctomycetota bacterium]|nr:hypothetical protein [Planctomycetota bacterium]